MRATIENTGWVLIKADTNSEWDNCDYAIIRITKDWIATMRKRVAAATALSDDYTFYKHCYFESPEGFYINREGETEIALGETECWTFIDIAQEELQLLPVPASRLDCFQLSVTKNGTAYYTAYGKHTSEQFFTESFDINQWITATIGASLNQ